MAKKIGENHLSEMLDRGRRELGGFLYPDSNIAQPMYPARVGGELAKESDSHGESRSVINEHLERAQDDPGRDDPGRDGPQMDK